MVRGVACRISWPRRKSSKKWPAPVLSIEPPRAWRGHRRRWRALAAAPPVAVLVACTPPANLAARAALCQQALLVLHPEAGEIGSGTAAAGAGADSNRVTLSYRVSGTPQSVTCRFAPGETDRLTLAGLA